MRLPATNMPRREPEVMARPKPPENRLVPTMVGRTLEAWCRACNGRGVDLLAPCLARQSGKHILLDAKSDKLREVAR
jgi:hypothetical protein